VKLRNLFEAPQQRTAVVAFGRMNPPTIGHAKLVDAVKSQDGDPYIFLSQSQKPKTDPLAFEDKLRYAKFFFPNVTIGNSEVRTPIQMMQKLEALGYTDIIYVAGSDRVPAFEKLFNDYNGKDYNFNSIQVVSAGERDPDADGAEGMSASKMRAAAAAGDLESFKQGVPQQEVADEMFAAVRQGMGIRDEVPAESIQEDENDIAALDAEVAEIKNAMDDIQNKYPQIGTKYAVWGVSDGIPLAKKFMSDEDFATWTELGKKRDEARKALHTAKMSLPKQPRNTNKWGDNRGYGQGRYMGDSVDNGVSKDNEDKFHNELDDLVHKYFGDSPDEEKMKKKYKVKESDLVLDKSRLRSHIISLIADKIAATDDIEQLSKWLKLIVGKELSPRGSRYQITSEDIVMALEVCKSKRKKMRESEYTGPLSDKQKELLRKGYKLNKDGVPYWDPDGARVSPFYRDELGPGWDQDSLDRDADEIEPGASARLDRARTDPNSSYRANTTTNFSGGGSTTRHRDGRVERQPGINANISTTTSKKPGEKLRTKTKFRGNL
jgi:nicotinic acid mononucleotide adenylyltransferase